MLKGRILIADDEEKYALATSRLLKRKGYECNVAASGDMAMEMLQQDLYHLLMADIRMPGNLQLELVTHLSSLAPGLPIILVTGHPSIETAAEAVELNIVAYLVKPVESDKLLELVERSVLRYQSLLTIRETTASVERWCREMKEMETLLSQKGGRTTKLDIQSFSAMNLTNMLRCMENQHRLIELLTTASENDSAVCRLVKCEIVETLTESLQQAVDVLWRSRRSFKSKEIGELRTRLERVLEEVQRHQ